jgi:hypothetical protein
MDTNTASTSTTTGTKSQSFGERFVAALKRAKAVVVDPVGMWPQIRNEGGDEKSLYRDFLLMMMAISPVCQFIGQCLFGDGKVGEVLGLGLVMYVFGLVLVYIMALVILKLSGLFGGSTTRLACLRFVAYSYSASFLLGFLAILPFGLIVLLSGILSLYSLYIFYSGIPVMTGVPAERSFGFFAAAIASAIAVSLLFGILTSPVVKLFVPAPV